MDELAVDTERGPRVQLDRSCSLADEARLLRREIVEALHACGGGHYGGSLSVLDLLLTLYRRQLRVAPSLPNHPGRDRLLLSKGHAALSLYAVLRRLGYFDHPLEGYGSAGSPLEGHPDMTALPGVDFSTGSLGQGLSVGVGMALALRGSGSRVWVILGDGECQEGQVWEAAMLAAQLRLDNIHAIIDHNRFQEWGWNREPADGGTRAAPPIDRLAEKWSAFGWRVHTVDGHDHEALASVYTEMTSSRGGPSLAIADTVKGKGFPLLEADPVRFHCGSVTREEHAELLRSLS